MAPNKTFSHINSIAQAEHDEITSRKKVATWIYSNSVAYEDTNFVEGDSPSVLAINTDLGHNGHNGYISNDGDGDLKIEFSNNGTTYGGLHTIKREEVLEFNGMNIAKIRLTWVADTSYRVFVV